jgi:hypothetical protein
MGGGVDFEVLDPRERNVGAKAVPRRAETRGEGG